MNSTKTQEMDREDEDEMAIYANADIVFNDDRRTRVKDSDTKRQRMLQIAGSVWSRMHGAAAVCLVLFCVLMTVIIVLRVQLSTETHNCQTEIKNFTEERNQLQKKYTDLEEKRNQLQKKYTDLEEKRNQLQNNYKEIKYERDQLQNNYTGIKYERDGLLNENTRLKNNVTQLAIKIAKLTEGRNSSNMINTTYTTSTYLYK
ncbi:uncharacterized protein LOC113054239 [Carassius auratus]|uniref:Uncharacterized protein LOC113054239 n=1 Tax=Carassius auratus TaxID=7957 RepID=A0A6P6KT16_CARAU|nr:uncharacterized protein LOC113054239 [Carassius auratus]